MTALIKFFSSPGTAAAPGMSFFSDQDTGFYRRAADTIGVRGATVFESGDVTIGPDDLAFGNAIGVQRVRLFNGAAEGSLTIYGVNDNVRTAIDLGPTRGALPAAGPLCEIALYRTQDQAVDFERMRLTAGSADIPHYRFRVEKGGAGSYRQIVFAFEEVTPGVAHLPLTIETPAAGAGFTFKDYGAAGNDWRYVRSDGVQYLRTRAGHDAAGVGANVSLDIQNTLDAIGGIGRTGLDLLPTSGLLPTTQALTEIVMYRTTDKTVNYERLNIFSGMANDVADGGWRLGMEAAGAGRLRDIRFSHETGGSWDGVSSVTAGNEVFLQFTAVRAGQSVPIAIQSGHLRFDTASMGGLAATHYIGRGGGSNFTFNVPTGGTHLLSVNNVAVVSVNGAGLSAIGVASFAAGAVGAPALTFTSDQDSGIYSIGANNLGVAVGGAKVLDVGAAGLGVTGAVAATSYTVGATPGATFTGAVTSITVVNGIVTAAS